MSIAEAPNHAGAIDISPADAVTIDGFTLKLHLPELYRVMALGLSNTVSSQLQGSGLHTAGDGTPTVLQVLQGAVKDIGQVANVENRNVVLEEIPDGVQPVILGVAIDYNDGLLTFNCSETIKIKPAASMVDLFGFFLGNSAGDLTVVLAGARVQEVDNSTVYITLTELQRSLAIALSGTPGGDGSATIIDIAQGGIRDMANNTNEATVGITLTETADTTKPIALNVTIDYNNGAIVVNCSETIDTTPASQIDLSKIAIVDASGDSEPRLSAAPSGATYVEALDKTWFSLRVTEDQRVSALKKAGVPGGNGGAVVLDFYAGAFKDTAQNSNADNLGIHVFEIPDTTIPTIINASLDYFTGRLEVFVDEIVDVSVASKVNLSNVFIADVSGDRAISLVGATISTTDTMMSFNITLTEEQRVQATKLSSSQWGHVHPGNGKAVVLDCYAGCEFSRSCFLASVSSFNSCPFRHIRTHYPPKVLADIAGNQNSEQLAIVINETPNTVPPTVTGITVQLGTGVVTIAASETLDITPASRVDLSRIHFYDSGSPQRSLYLTGATVDAVDATQIIVRLTEAQRVGAIEMSAGGWGLGGHNTVAMVANFHAGAFFDMSNNTNEAASNLAVAEVADEIVPVLERIEINYGTGFTTLSFSETIDATPLSHVQVDNTTDQGNGAPYAGSIYPKAFFTDSAGTTATNDVHLFGSTVIATDAANVSFTLTEEQRVNALKLSSLPGGDTGALRFSMVGHGFVRDIAQNPSGQQLLLPVVEVADTIPPRLIAAWIDFNYGILRFNASETLDVTSATRESDGTGKAGTTWQGYVDLGRMYISASTTGTEISLAGATLNEVDGIYVNMTLTETQRVNAIILAAYTAGSIYLRAQTSAVIDMAQNPNAEEFAVPMTESEDTVSPKITKVSLNYGTGRLRLNVSEIVDVASAIGATSYVNMSQMFLADKSRDEYVSLVGASALTGDGDYIDIQLTEAQRVDAISVSGTPGGNGSAIVFDAAYSAFRDIGGNGNDDVFNLAVVETNDTIAPLLERAAIDYGTGIVTFSFSETIDITPLTMVDLSKLHIVETSGGSDIVLTGAVVTPLTGGTRQSALNSPNVTLTLNEVQRVAALERSNTKNSDGAGDGTECRFDVGAGAFTDIAGNAIAAVANVSFVEIADSVAPTIVSATINYNNGTLTILASETLDLTPAESLVNLSRIAISNGNRAEGFTLEGANATSGDGYYIEIVLTEVQRVQALRESSTSGGDGSARVLHVDAGAVQDIGVNPNVALVSTTLFEEGDTTKPNILGARIQYSTGVLTVTMSEIVDTSISNAVMLDKFFISDSTGGALISLVGATVATSVGLEFQVTLTELQRIRAIEVSSVAGGNGGAAVLDVNAGGIQDTALNYMEAATGGIELVENADTVLPTIQGVTLNYTTGEMVITVSEIVDAVPASDVVASSLFIGTDAGTNTIQLAGTTSLGDSVVVAENRLTEIKITITEKMRAQAIAISGTDGGDGSAAVLNIDAGAFKDIAQNNNAQASGLAMTETRDSQRPTATACRIEYGIGRVTLFADEIVDVTPASSKVDLSRIFIANSSGATDVAATGATVTETDGVIIVLDLTETQRVAAQYISGLFPGDYGNATLNLLQGAFVDIGQNPNVATPGIVCEELADAVPPQITAAELFLSEGVLRVFFSETIDATPATLVNFSKISLVNAPGDEMHLVDANVTALDGLSVNITISEVQRAAAIAMSATPGGDGQALTFAAEVGAFLDLAHNKNVISLALALTEHADVVAPKVLDGHINFADGTLRIRVSEIVDLTPSSNVNVSLLEVSNTSGHFNHSLRLNGTSVEALDSTTIIVTLTEKQRSKAIAFSATSGGDNSAVVLNVYPGAFKDVATVENGEFRGVYLTEAPDVSGPTLSNARIHYGTGTITLDASETIGWFIARFARHTGSDTKQRSPPPPPQHPPLTTNHPSFSPPSRLISCLCPKWYLVDQHHKLEHWCGYASRWVNYSGPHLERRR